jgi:hypothetical protein
MAEQARSTAIHPEQRAAYLTKAVASFTSDRVTADEAYLMVKKAIELFQRKGRAALAEITGDKDHYFSHKDMYVFQPGWPVSGIRRQCRKTETESVPLTGLDGRKLVADAFSLPASGGWVDYILNPSRIRSKVNFVYRSSDE